MTKIPVVKEIIPEDFRDVFDKELSDEVLEVDILKGLELLVEPLSTQAPSQTVGRPSRAMRVTLPAQNVAKLATNKGKFR